VEEIRSGAAVVPEGRLFYEDAGTGMPPVVFISGGSMLDRRGWDGQFRELAHRYRVIRYDLRGLGASSQATAAFSPYDDLESLLDTAASNAPFLLATRLPAAWRSTSASSGQSA
jgi:pimeloyl-ACP methyl ester carboxylesterase